MRAITIEQYGGPEVVQYQNNAPVPQPADGEVLVEVACAGINFMDIHTRQGKYANSMTYGVRAPCTLGMEGAGTIVALGNGVNSLKVGQRVAWCISWGSFAEYACVPATLIAVIPDEIGFDVAASAMFQGCTAHYLVNDVARLSQGMDCLIHAASGSIGQILIQMAKIAGATVYATASTDEKRAVASEQGADFVLPYDEGRFADRIKELTSGNGVDVVFDSLGKATLRDSMRATRKRGLIINYGNVSGSVKDLDPYELGEQRSLFLTRPRLSDYMADQQTVQRRADAIFSAMINRQLFIDISERVDFSDIPTVHTAIESRRQIGKCVAWIGRRDVF